MKETNFSFDYEYITNICNITIDYYILNKPKLKN